MCGVEADSGLVHLCVSALTSYLVRVLTSCVLCAVSVESEGPYAPEELLPEAVSVMRGKIAAIRAAAEALLQDAQDIGGAPSGPDADGDVEMGGA